MMTIVSSMIQYDSYDSNDSSIIQYVFFRVENDSKVIFNITYIKSQKVSNALRHILMEIIL